MTTVSTNPVTSARTLVDAGQELVDKIIRHAANVTDGGKLIDEHQVHTCLLYTSPSPRD